MADLGWFQQQPDRMWFGPSGHIRSEDAEAVFKALLPEDLWEALTDVVQDFTFKMTQTFPTSHLPQPLIRDGRGNVIHRLRPDPYERPL